MPFKSKAQVRACFAKKDKDWNCHEWADHTKSIKALPEKASAFGVMLGKMAASLPPSPAMPRAMPAIPKPPSMAATTPSAPNVALPLGSPGASPSLSANAMLASSGMNTNPAAMNAASQSISRTGSVGEKMGCNQGMKKRKTKKKRM